MIPVEFRGSPDAIQTLWVRREMLKQAIASELQLFGPWAVSLEMREIGPKHDLGRARWSLHIEADYTEDRAAVCARIARTISDEVESLLGGQAGIVWLALPVMGVAVSHPSVLASAP